MGFLKIRTVYRFDALVLIPSLLVIPSLIGLQPFLPRFLEVIVILLRLVIFPLLIIFYLRKNANFNWIAILTAYLLILTLVFPPPLFNDYKLMFLNITTSVTFFMLGNYLVNRKGDNSDFKYLAYGVNAFNIISIAIYFLIAVNLVDIRDIYDHIRRPLDFNLSRFALGNAIELPFGMTCLLFTSILLVNRKEPFIFSTSLNLLLAIISQSRVVVIIALILFIHEFLKSNWKIKAVFIIIFILLIPLIVRHFEPILNSFIDRLKGHDLGSTHNRLAHVKTILNNFDFFGFVFGHGLTSSSVLLKLTEGAYKSVESVILQLVYDIGIFGFFIFFAPVFYWNSLYMINGKHRLSLLFVYLQILLLLPVNGFMPFTFLLFGVCSKYSPTKKANSLSISTITENQAF